MLWLLELNPCGGTMLLLELNSCGATMLLLKLNPYGATRLLLKLNPCGATNEKYHQLGKKNCISPPFSSTFSNFFSPQHDIWPDPLPG